MNQIDLDGRTGVVTGGATGIGYAIAERLIASDAAVSLWDIDDDGVGATAETLAAKGGAVHAAVVDVADQSAVAAGMEATLDRFGAIDLLVNNAGIAGADKKNWEYTVEEWNEVVAIDLTGVFLCCRAVVPHIMERGYGRIVNIASIAGKEGNPNAGAYNAAKAGVIGFTKSLGKELAEGGVIVNCVTPAAIETDIFKQLSQEHIDYMLSKIPMGRLGLASEAAALVAWLCSSDCSFSTGAVFDLSGGRATY